MIVFDELHHGYYVHGCTVHPYADTNMQELNANLRKEQHNMLPRRGLQGTQCVGFEFIASKQLRDTFDKLYKSYINIFILLLNNNTYNINNFLFKIPLY